ncbi:MAG: nucleotidyltransferase family protein [Planctomyces sp.]|nr:nucleotidyltransferase family protein [Planctomyces sp.]
MTIIDDNPISWERMIGAVEDVQRRLERAVRALEAAGVPYAICGGQAVAAWVSKIDRAAVRTTVDVDVLLRREDFPAAKSALEHSGFVHRHVRGVTMFLDGDAGRPREAVHVVFANEKVRSEYLESSPDVSERLPGPPFDVLELAALLRMKLTSFRDKDRTHVRDMLEVGLIDDTWIASLPRVLGDRLRRLIDTPEG